MPNPKYQALAHEVVANVSQRMAVELLDAADEIARQTQMNPVLVRETMLASIDEGLLALYVRHPDELPARVARA